MKVVLATDGSKNSLHAAKVLAALPCREPLEVEVVSAVVHPSLHPADTSATWPQEFWDELNAAANAAADQVATIVQGAATNVTPTVCEGHAGQVIVQRAADISADLIVLGAQGHSAIGRVMLGSVSDYVANHADCSVLVVRGSAAGQEVPRAITIAYDGSRRAEIAVDQYGQFDWPASTTTRVVTIVPMIRFFGKDILPEALGHRTEQHQIAGRASEHAAQRIAAAGPKPSCRVVEAEHVGQGIIDQADEQASDLIMIGDSGLGAISQMMLGSVSKFVLRHATVSVWIARRRD
jgi:nucleotide-binding universal stress UspA family protein